MVGLIDELTLEQIDPQTGDSLGCWKTINTDQDSETSDAEECLYALKSQSINNEVIVSFIDAVESGKLQLLEKRTDVGYDLNDKDHIEQEVAPFAQTDLLLEEIANLKLEVTSSGKFTVKQNSRRTDRDRYSSVSYGIWYISAYEDNYTKAQEGDMSDFLLIN